MVDFDDPDAKEQVKFAVYVHYLQAASIIIQRYCHSPQQMVTSIGQTKAFRKIQTVKDYDRELLEKFLRNAWFTEIQARIPQKFPEIIPYSNHWLAVQIYYAMYLLVRGFFIAAKREVKPTHEAALRAFAGEVKTRPDLFAPPWCLLASGDPDGSIVFSNCAKQKVENLNPLTRPTIDNCWDLLAGFFRTTRRKRLMKSIEGWKTEKKRKRIRRPEREAVAQKLAPTTMMDALYRLRIRSNYEDADLYLTGSADEEEVQAYFDAAVRILKSGMLNLELLIARHIGAKNFTQIVESFQEKDRSNFSETTIQLRKKAILNALKESS